MSVAYFVVFNCDDPGFDSFVDGKMLTHRLEEVNAIATRLDLKAFEDYAFQDLSEYGGADMEVQWFDAQEGLHWISSIRRHLDENPGAVKDAGAVV